MLSREYAYNDEPGGMEERHGDVIQGPPEIVAERLLQFLTQNKFV